MQVRGQVAAAVSVGVVALVPKVLQAAVDGEGVEVPGCEGMAVLPGGANNTYLQAAVDEGLQRGQAGGGPGGQPGHRGHVAVDLPGGKAMTWVNIRRGVGFRILLSCPSHAIRSTHLQGRERGGPVHRWAVREAGRSRVRRQGRDGLEVFGKLTKQAQGNEDDDRGEDNMRYEVNSKTARGGDGGADLVIDFGAHGARGVFELGRGLPARHDVVRVHLLSVR